MKTFKDLLPETSDAVQAMYEGLLTQSKRKDFEIDMDSFGKSNGKICFGCAATCAVQQATGINLTPASINTLKDRTTKLKIDYEDLHSFEHAIDMFRKGYSELLFYYYGFKNCKELGEKYKPNFYLFDDDWEEQMPLVKDYIERLRTAGY